jgi:glyceraldehyde 3-phosphate dehydrogenase
MKRIPKIAINGFGRIGRLVLRSLLKTEGIEVIAINDLADVETLAHLFKHDSAQGNFDGEVKSTEHALIVDGVSISITKESDPAQLPWQELDIDLVIECTGIFTNRQDANKHIEAGAKKVIISAPAKGDIKTIVIGVNDDLLTETDTIVSNASCTTNCLAPIAKLLNDNFGIEKGYISTVHAYTADQRLQDAPHKDLRRSRAAALSIIPTTTGAATAVGLVIPELKGKLDGIALRVPIPTGSLTDLTAVLSKNVTAEEVNSLFKNAAENELSGILQYSEAPIVSIDIVGNSHSCIYDAPLTSANGNLVKIIAWYDNEFGYASRTAQLAVKMLS